jgi:hypothetical protein
MAHTYNPSYLGGSQRLKDCGLRPWPGKKQNVIPIQKIAKRKKVTKGLLKWQSPA